MIRVIIAGGRDQQLSKNDKFFLDNNVIPLGQIEIIQGGATGVDHEARCWAESKGVVVTTFKADWLRFGRGAGPMRNRKMAEYAKRCKERHICILFPGGRGTQSMYQIAKQYGIEIWDMR